MLFVSFWWYQPSNWQGGNMEATSCDIASSPATSGIGEHSQAESHRQQHVHVWALHLLSPPNEWSHSWTLISWAFGEPAIFHHLYTHNSRFILWGGRRRRKKNQLVLNLFMDFCDQCKSTQRGSLGPGSSQLMWLKGNCHWCCFSLPLGSKSMWVLSRPGRHTRGTSSSLTLHPRRSWTAEGTGGDEGTTARIHRSHCQVTGANCGSNQGWKYGLLIG